MTDLAGGITTLGSNHDQQVASAFLPNGFLRGFEYNNRHLISRLTYNGAAETVLGESYEYDWNDRMAQRRNFVGDTLHVYGYDPAAQITADQRQVKVEAGIVCPDPMVPDSCSMTYEWQNDALLAYSYDPAGNRTDRGGQSDTGNRLNGFDGYTYEYDADGNLTRKVKAGVRRPDGHAEQPGADDRRLALSAGHGVVRLQRLRPAGAAYLAGRHGDALPIRRRRPADGG